MTATNNNYDTLIVGGGVIGLSIAWELAQQGEKVCVVERGQLGQEASWAGAGMIPSGPAESLWEEATPFEQLEGLSQHLHRRVAPTLVGANRHRQRVSPMWHAPPSSNLA